MDGKKIIQLNGKGDWNVNNIAKKINNEYINRNDLIDYINNINYDLQFKYSKNKKVIVCNVINDICNIIIEKSEKSKN